MDAVILFSHGSLLCGAGEALAAHAARLRAQGLAPVVEIGYLNYSEPPFVEAVAKCVAAGADRILVTPYFLVPGKFVKVDLPRVVEEAQAAYPEIKFEVAEAIGYDVELAEAISASARAAVPPEAWQDDLKRAALACRANPECPLYGTPSCPATPEAARPVAEPLESAR